MCVCVVELGIKSQSLLAIDSEKGCVCVLCVWREEGGRGQLISVVTAPLLMPSRKTVDRLGFYCAILSNLY